MVLWVGDYSANEICELLCGRPWCVFTVGDDRASDFARVPFFSVRGDDACEVPFRVRRQHVGSADSLCGIHTHVQRGVAGVTETACVIVELQRGDAEVEKDSGDRRVSALVENLRNVVVRGTRSLKAGTKRGEPRRCDVNSRGVSIDSNHVDVVIRAQDAFGVTTHTQSEVDNDGRNVAGPCFFDSSSQQFDAHVEQNGNVWICHGLLLPGCCCVWCC